jgi:hypothetical protein
MLTRGVAAEHVRKICGHLSEEMTERYNRPTPETIRMLTEPHPAEFLALENGENSGKNRVYNVEVIN